MTDAVSNVPNASAGDDCSFGRSMLHRLLDEGLADIKAGNGRPADEVFAEIEKAYGFAETDEK